MDHLSKEKLDDFIKKAADYSTYHEPTEYWTKSWLKVIHPEQLKSIKGKRALVETLDDYIGDALDNSYEEIYNILKEITHES